MADQTIGAYAELESAVDDAINKLTGADHSVAEVIEAYNTAQNLKARLTGPVKVVVGGEFSSGKSTFIKMLLGRHVVQTQASASSMPTVNFQYSAKPGFRAVGAKNSRDIPDLGALSDDELHKLERLEVMTDLPFLKKFELFDTPGTSDPTRDVDQLLTVVDQADFIIWCTNATQAWRESERIMWDAMPDELKKRSLLLVTHVDLPSVKPSIDRLMKRLTKDASSLFREIIPVELLLASGARDGDGKVTDPAAWDASGGGKCIAEMDAVFTEIRAESFKYAEHELATKVMPYIEAKLSSTKSFMIYWARQLDETKSQTKGADSAAVSLGYIKLLESMLKFLAGNFELSAEDITKLTNRLKEVRDLIEASLLQEGADAHLEKNQGAIAQLDWEFHHISMLA